MRDLVRGLSLPALLAGALLALAVRRPRAELGPPAYWVADRDAGALIGLDADLLAVARRDWPWPLALAPAPGDGLWVASAPAGHPGGGQRLSLLDPDVGEVAGWDVGRVLDLEAAPGGGLVWLEERAGVRLLARVDRAGRRRATAAPPGSAFLALGARGGPGADARAGLGGERGPGPGLVRGRGGHAAARRAALPARRVRGRRDGGWGSALRAPRSPRAQGGGRRRAARTGRLRLPGGRRPALTVTPGCRTCACGARAWCGSPRARGRPRPAGPDCAARRPSRAGTRGRPGRRRSVCPPGRPSE